MPEWRSYSEPITLDVSSPEAVSILLSLIRAQGVVTRGLSVERILDSYGRPLGGP